MAKGTACSICRLVSLMMACKRSWARALRMRSKKKTHASARHSPEHPEAPEVVAHFPAHAANQRVGVEISGPGNDGLNGAVKIPLGAGAQAANVPALQARDEVVEDVAGFRAGRATRFRSEAGISPSPSPEWDRHPAPCRRGPAPGSAEAAGAFPATPPGGQESGGRATIGRG